MGPTVNDHEDWLADLGQKVTGIFYWNASHEANAEVFIEAADMPCLGVPAAFFVLASVQRPF